jgi:hypothetical protein
MSPGFPEFKGKGRKDKKKDKTLLFQCESSEN